MSPGSLSRGSAAAPPCRPLRQREKLRPPNPPDRRNQAGSIGFAPNGRPRATPDPYSGRQNLPTLAVCELSNGPAGSDRFPKVPREQPFAPPYAAHGQAIPGCGVLSPRGSNLPWFSKPRRRHLLYSPEIGNPPSNSSTIWTDNVNRANRHIQIFIFVTG